MSDEILLKKRIVDYDETKSFGMNDYLFVDNTTKGTRKLRATEMENNIVESVGGDIVLNDWISDSFISTVQIVDLNTSPQHSSNYRYLVSDCTPGDVFTINGKGGGDPRLWGFLHNTGLVLSTSSAGLTGNNLQVTAPANAVKIVINDNDKTGNCYRNGVLLSDWIDNNYIKLTATVDLENPQHSTGWRYQVHDCEANDRFTLNGKGGGIPRFYAFIGETGLVLSCASAGFEANNFIVTAPKNAVQIVINDNSMQGKNYKHGSLRSRYLGKTCSILGDSISTYVGYVPDDSRALYPKPNYGMDSVEKTWWMKVIKALGMRLNKNNSWASTRVSTSKNNSDDANAACQVSRCQDLGSNPDVIIVWMGTNDYNYNTPLGTYDGRSEVPTVTNTFREAYAVMLSRILSKYKTAEVWVCTLPYTGHANDNVFPEMNDSGIPLLDYNKAIIEIADAFGVKVLHHDSCGITYYNRAAYVMSSGNDVHPNEAGHSLIANNDIRQMDPSVKTVY